LDKLVERIPVKALAARRLAVSRTELVAITQALSGVHRSNTAGWYKCSRGRYNFYFFFVLSIYFFNVGICDKICQKKTIFKIYLKL
jgi:hypothetical protein